MLGSSYFSFKSIAKDNNNFEPQNRAFQYDAH